MTGDEESMGRAKLGDRGWKIENGAGNGGPAGPPYHNGEPSRGGGRRLAQPEAAMVNWFWLSFDSRGNFDTGFENCMLPGNINERIVTFANKYKGFEGHLFLKTGQNGG